MWLGLVATIAVIALGAYRTLLYADDAAQAPAIAQSRPAAPPAAAPARPAVVVSSGPAAAIPTSTPGPSRIVDAPAAAPTTGVDWFTQLSDLPGMAARSIAGDQPAAPPVATPDRGSSSAAPTAVARTGSAAPTPPPPVVVNPAAARATALALQPTPEIIADFLPPAPRGAGSNVIVPTPTHRVAPSSAERAPTDADEPPPATPVSTARPTFTPAPTRSAAADARPRAAADANPTATRTPRPTRVPRQVWQRRPNGFPTPPAQPRSPRARPTPGNPPFVPPPIRNGDNKWGVGIYKDSNRVLDTLKETEPGVILLMDPSEGWAKRVREEFPNAFIVGRRYKPEDQQPVDNPEKRGADFADWVAELAVPLKGTVDAWMSYNEVLGSEPSQDYANYNRFQVAFAKRLQNGYGIAAIAANDGSGALEPEDYPTYFAEAIRASQFFGVHAYSPPGTSSIKIDAEFNALRYRKIHDALERAGIHGVKMVLTETGLGDGFRQGISSDEQMAADFAWFTAELRKDPYVIGQAAFGLFDATGAWPRFDLTDTAVIRLMPQLLGKH